MVTSHPGMAAHREPLPAPAGGDPSQRPGRLPPASIIVVAFRSETTLPACLEAVARLDYPGEVETIVVDNGPGDAAARLVAARFPSVRLVAPGRNLGFAAGVLAGLDASRGEILALLNPDAIPRPGWLRALAAVLVADPGVGLAGSKVLEPDGRTIQHAGGRLLPNGLSAHLGRGEPDDGRWDVPSDVDYVTGAALALRRETVARFGLFDPGYFPAYYEEAELAVRLRAAGLAVRYVPEAVATHVEAASTGVATRSFLDAYHRNRVRFLLKTASPADLLFRVLPAEARWVLRSLPPNNGASVARAWGGNLLRLPAILARRVRGERP